MHKIKSRLPVLLSLLLAATALADTTNTAIVPAFRAKPKFWLQRHTNYLQEAKQGPYDIVFLGDSITDFWHDRGSNVWNQYYAPRHALNLGIRGDLTQQVLWRIDNGELDGLHPKVLVLLLGTNNNGRDKPGKPVRNTPAETIAGMTRVVQEVREKLPETKILLLAIFPRSIPGDPVRDKIAEVNRIISKLDDQRNVFYLDIGSKFLDDKGFFLPDSFRADNLHPQAKGYDIWGAAVKDKLAELMK